MRVLQSNIRVEPIRATPARRPSAQSTSAATDQTPYAFGPGLREASGLRRTNSAPKTGNRPPRYEERGSRCRTHERMDQRPRSAYIYAQRTGPSSPRPRHRPGVGHMAPSRCAVGHAPKRTNVPSTPREARPPGGSPPPAGLKALATRELLIGYEKALGSHALRCGQVCRGNR